MVGTTRQAAFVSRDAYNSRQQAEFIRQLRLLYQRSVRTRTSVRVADPLSIHMPVATQTNQALPQGWGPAAAAAAAATAEGIQAAAGGSADVEDPCPAGQQQQQQQPTQATVNTAAPAAAAATEVQPQQQQEVEEDSDDEPPGVMDASEEDDEPEYGEGDDEEEEMAEVGYDSSEDADLDIDPGPPRTGNYHNTTTPATTATQAIRNAWDRASRRAAAVASPQQPQQQQLGFSATVPLLPPEAWRRPAACSFLQRSVAFEGCQRLTSHMVDMQRRSERWTVSVTLQDVDMASGYVAGTMHARDIPDVSHCIETFWEGCIIDDVNHTFYTRAWGASKETDLQHWAKFDAFAGIGAAVRQYSGRCGQLEQHPVIYMRWKEQCFVQPQQRDCGLTIAGFYYVALDRRTGQLQGYYYDPHSSPYQELRLSVCRGGSSSSSGGSSRSGSAGPAAAGVSFATYSFA